MNFAIRNLLEHLYGADAARTILPRLVRILDAHRSRKTGSEQRAARADFSGRDSILITYGDQVREPGVKPLRSLAEFAEQHLAGVVSAIHLLPFYPASSDDGFSVKDYLAVDSALGDWSDIARLRERFDLMFDAVFNHLSAQSQWFQRFLQDDPNYRDYFVTVEGEPDLSRVVRPRALPLLTVFQTAAGPRKVWTTFSADQVDLNARNPEVLLALIEVLLFYVARGARFIRLDAIAYLWKEIGTSCIHRPQTHRIIQLMRAVLDDVAPGVLLLTETNVPHAENLSYFGDGANEAQLVYNFALPPLVLHTLSSANAETLNRWVQSLALPSDRVTFFNFLASHDGIGLNPVRGILSQPELDGLVERAQAHGGFISYKHNADGSKSPYELNINYFDALSNPAGHEPIDTQIQRFLVAQAIMLSLAGVPGIYFHSLFGSRGDRAGADASGIPRRINRQRLSRSELELDLASPPSLRARIFSPYCELLNLRRSHPAFDPRGRQEVVECDPRVFALLRASPDGPGRALCLHNVSDESVSLSVQLTGEAKNQLAGSVADSDGQIRRTLQPYEVAWLTGGIS
jgi:sucrose phosphorylase